MADFTISLSMLDTKALVFLFTLIIRALHNDFMCEMKFYLLKYKVSLMIKNWNIQRFKLQNQVLLGMYQQYEIILHHLL